MDSEGRGEFERRLQLLNESLAAWREHADSSEDESAYQLHRKDAQYLSDEA